MSQAGSCASCGRDMEFLGEEQLQLGQAGIILGQLSNLLAGSLEAEIWECPSCGRGHGLNDPKCPFRGANNPLI